MRSEMRRWVAAIAVGCTLIGTAGCDTNVADQMKEEASDEETEKKSSESEEGPVPGDVSRAMSWGVVTLSTERQPAAVVANLKEAVASNDKLELFGTFELGGGDGAERAEKTGGDGAESDRAAAGSARLLMVGNPHLGTPVMEGAQSAAIELPQRILVWTDGAETKVSVNAPSYVAERHDVEKLDLFLGQMEDGLSALAEGATDGAFESFPERGHISVDTGQGLSVAESDNGVTDTIGVLKKAIAEHSEAKLLKHVDHAANAKSVDRSLPNTHLLVVSVPEQSEFVAAGARAGLDLPVRIAVWGNRDGAIALAFDDPSYLAQRHRLEGVDAAVEALGKRLQSFADEATKEL